MIAETKKHFEGQLEKADCMDRLKMPYHQKIRYIHLDQYLEHRKKTREIFNRIL